MATNVRKIVNFDDVDDGSITDRSVNERIKSMNENLTQQSLQLATILHSTLELEKLFELFDAHISNLLPHDGMSYENSEEDAYIQFGAICHHQCHYRIVLLDKYLGEITLYRKQPFKDSEVGVLEQLIAALMYSLRNALLYKRALEKAYIDPLTGLNNRAAFNNTLKQEFDFALRHDSELALLVIDIDKFKAVNDNFGHIAGDIALKSIADVMLDCVRQSDVVFRYGGEEFIIVLRKSDLVGAELLAERLRVAVKNYDCKYDGLKINLSVSIGVSTLRNNDNEMDFIDRADRALYLAKESGRNCVKTEVDVNNLDNDD